MKGIVKFLIRVMAGILLGGCVGISQTPNAIMQATAPADPTYTPELHLTPVTTPLATPSPVSLVRLPESDQVIFTIPNTEPWSGKEGDSRPDWKGWGAETFAVAPDGAFWIADTAVFPNRLLHFSPQGQLLKEITLQDISVFAYDLLVRQQDIWLLDISAQQPRVVQLSLAGELLSAVDIPPEVMTVDGSFVGNGAFALLPGGEGELLLATLNGYYELVNASGEVVAEPLESLALDGHTYHEGIYDPATGTRPAYLDGASLETGAGFMVESPLLGFNLDGSFVLAGQAQTGDDQWDGQVKYFDAAGNLLGTARQRPQTFYKDWNHHLAFGPDGAVYQLLSAPDHSVQILQLGFAETLPPRPDILPLSPTPLTPLSASEPAATDEAQARNTLIEFFADLSAGSYAEAVAHFGGEAAEFARQPLPGETLGEYWDYLCQVSWCLPVAQITEVEPVSENELIFYAVFMHPDGTRFEIGACCGADPAATPPLWQFAFPVQRINGVWKVMRPPLFTP